jgi:hypothetical protein
MPNDQIAWEQLQPGDHVMLTWPEGVQSEYVVTERGWLRAASVTAADENNLHAALTAAGHLKSGIEGL